MMDGMIGIGTNVGAAMVISTSVAVRNDGNSGQRHSRPRHEDDDDDDDDNTVGVVLIGDDGRGDKYDVTNTYEQKEEER